MKLNNKGFAISSIMYIILVLAVVLIALILATLSSRKLILDKLRDEVLTTIYDAPNVTYRQTITELKNEVIAYMTDNSLEKESMKVDTLTSSIDVEVLEKYKLNGKYITAVQNTDSYDVYLGKASTINNTTQLPKNTIDIIDYKIYGNSYQETSVQGKNLFDIKSVSSFYNSNSDVSTVSTLEGEMIISNRGIYGAYIYGDSNIKNLESGTYTLSADVMAMYSDFGKNIGLGFGYYDTSGELKNLLGYSELTDIEKWERISYTFTISEDTEIFGFIFQAMGSSENYTSLNVKFKNIQLEKSDVPTSYEEYIPNKPSIKYPSEVMSVGKRTKNLFNPNTVADNNKYINASSGEQTTPSSTGGEWRSSDFISVTAGKIYHFNANSSNASLAGIAWFDGNKNYISGLNTTSITQNNGKIQAPTNASYLKVSWRIDESYNPNWQNTLQLELGEIETKYEPYGYKIPIKVEYDKGKNLFNLANATTQLLNFYEDYSGFTFLTLEAENMFSNGYSIGKFSDCCPDLKVGDKFILSFETNAIRNGVAVDYFYLDVYGKSIKTGTVYTCTQEMLDSKILIYTGETTGVYYNNIQLEIAGAGNQATEFEPYKQPITTNIFLDSTLKKIDSYSDYISFKDNTITQNLKEIVLNGNQTINLNGTVVTGYQTYHIANSIYKIKSLSSVLSSKLPGYENWNVANGKKREQLSTAVAALTFRLSETRKIEFTTTGIKEWLKDNPIDITYILESPVMSSITLPRIKVNDGVSKISIDTDVMPSNFEFTIIEKILEI